MWSLVLKIRLISQKEALANFQVSSFEKENLKNSKVTLFVT